MKFQVQNILAFSCMQKHEENTMRRDGMVSSMSREYEIQTSGDLSQDPLLSFNSAIIDKQKNLSDTLQRDKSSFELQEEENQNQLNECNQRKTKLETSCQVNEERRKSNKRTIRDINYKLCDVEASSSRLDSLNLDIHRTVCILYFYLKSSCCCDPCFHRQCM